MLLQLHLSCTNALSEVVHFLSFSYIYFGPILFSKLIFVPQLYYLLYTWLTYLMQHSMSIMLTVISKYKTNPIFQLHYEGCSEILLHSIKLQCMPILSTRFFSGFTPRMRKSANCDPEAKTLAQLHSWKMPVCPPTTQVSLSR